MNDYMWTQLTPFGQLVITAGARGVRQIEFRSDARTMRSGAVPPPARDVARAFERYFAGDAHALDKVRVDLSGVRSDFHRTVLRTLRRLIGPGQTISYGELAAAAGHPGAARAVGTVMANNPLPIIVPCHRVLASDGTLGGYGGGLEMKRGLLTIEGVNGLKARRGGRRRGS
jgi:methylated-DNA-[protein]-cysteine S-methyltransferase